MTNTTRTQKLNLINTYITEDTAAAILAEEEGRLNDAAVLWATVANLTARLNGLEG